MTHIPYVHLQELLPAITVCFDSRSIHITKRTVGLCKPDNVARAVGEQVIAGGDVRGGDHFGDVDADARKALELALRFVERHSAVEQPPVAAVAAADPVLDLKLPPLVESGGELLRAAFDVVRMD